MTEAVILSLPAEASIYDLINEWVLRFCLWSFAAICQLTTTFVILLSSPSLMNECGWLSPSTAMRDHLNCSMVIKALWRWAYLETRWVPRWRAKRSGLRMWGDVLAKSIWRGQLDKGVDIVWNDGQYVIFLTRREGNRELYDNISFWAWTYSNLWRQSPNYLLGCSFLDYKNTLRSISTQNPHLRSTLPSTRAVTLYSTMLCHFPSRTTRKTLILSLP